MEGVDIPSPGGDQSRGPAVIAVLSLFFGLSTVMVFLRSATRICITRNFGWDDATMALTQVKRNIICNELNKTYDGTGDKCCGSWVYRDGNLQWVWTT